jgi:hypothetical protein
MTLCRQGGGRVDDGFAHGLTAYWLHGFTADRGGTNAPSVPPAIPDDVADPAVVKAAGLVKLPTRVRWSPPARSYDLADRRQRARVYEQVLVVAERIVVGGSSTAVTTR